MSNYKALFWMRERCPTLFGRWVCPSRVQKHSSTMLKEAPSRFLSSGIARVDNSGPVCHRWTLFFSLSSFKNYSLTIFVISISISILIHLIFYFLFFIFIFDYFIKVLFVFNLILPSHFAIYYFFNLIFIFFMIFGLFC
jgi:hypothetical protein